MIHGKRLLESRPLLTRVPDDSLIVTDSIATKIPGAGRYRFVATRDQEGTYAMIYVPTGRPFQVDLSKLKAETFIAWWFNPRTGEATKSGVFQNDDKKTFVSPDLGEQLDWILVLDDFSQNYPPPGQLK